jgi:ankyrin repeat protein
MLENNNPNLPQMLQRCQSTCIDTTSAPASQRDHIRQEAIERVASQTLMSLSGNFGFSKLISTVNEYNQTLAHLSIVLGFHSLLRRLIEWDIDLEIADVNGLTALHFAYLKGDPRSVEVLQWGAASELVQDKLGRLPEDLGPENLMSEFDAYEDPIRTEGSQQVSPLPDPMPLHGVNDTEENEASVNL